MAGMIGSISFIALRGQVAPLGQTVEDVSRSGVDGHSIRRTGKRAAPSVLEGLVDAADAAGVTTALAAYRALRGTVVTVVDGRGQSHANCVVMDVEPVQVSPAATAVGGLNSPSAFLIRSRWTIQPTEIP